MFKYIISRDFIKYGGNFKMEIKMKHIETICNPELETNACKSGCGECQASCQSACKTSCTVGNQSCENKS